MRKSDFSIETLSTADHAHSQRPMLSVMITVYNRTNYLKRALQSVLEQLENEDAQIEVISDGGCEEEIKREIREIVLSCGDSRVLLYQSSKNIGHPHIFNKCINRAKGYWIHMLHDDDFVKTGFYKELKKGFDEPSVGLAFCRREHLDKEGQVTWTSLEEREEPGIIHNWIGKIFTMSRIQFSSVIVRRDVYEKVGGFNEKAASAFDWEMWKRAAVYFDAWFEPQIIGVCTKNGDSETDKLLINGQQIADGRLCIEITESLLPLKQSQLLSQRAKEHYASYGLYLAAQQLRKGKPDYALANLKEALKCTSSLVLQNDIKQKISQIENQHH